MKKYLLAGYLGMRDLYLGEFSVVGKILLFWLAPLCFVVGMCMTNFVRDAEEIIEDKKG